MGDAGCRGDHSDHTLSRAELPEEPASCEQAEGGAESAETAKGTMCWLWSTREVT